jgi:hypothetical protein
MRTVGLTWASDEFLPYAKLLAASSGQAGLDEFHLLGEAVLPRRFRRRHSSILREPRGRGYWLWKPWAIARTLDRMAEDDVLLWVDAGAHFAGSIELLISTMDTHGLDVWIMGEDFKESEFTKRDAFVLLDADREPYWSSPHRFASCMAFRRGDSTRKLAHAYLHHATDRRILTDDPNRCGKANLTGFVGHRHDQSIFSLLTKLAEIPVVHTDHVVEGMEPPHGQVVNHTRSHVSPAAINRFLLDHDLLGGRAPRP